LSTIRDLMPLWSYYLAGIAVFPFLFFCSASVLKARRGLCSGLSARSTPLHPAASALYDNRLSSSARLRSQEATALRFPLLYLRYRRLITRFSPSSPRSFPSTFSIFSPLRSFSGFTYSPSRCHGTGGAGSALDGRRRSSRKRLL